MAVDRFQLTIEAATRGEQDVARLEAAVNKFSAAAEKSGAKTKEMGNSFEGAGDKIRTAFADPLGSAGEAIESLFSRLGPTGAAIGALATAAAAAGAGVLALAKGFGDLYEQQANNALRLGVTIREYSQLSQISQEAGLSGDALVATMKGLSKALSDNSTEGRQAKAALAELGVAANTVEGEARPISELLGDIASRLGKIEEPARRADLAIKILGRGGMEVLPLMTEELRQQLIELDRAGYGWNRYSEEVGKSTDRAFDRVNRRWSEIKKMAGELASEAVLIASSPRPGLALSGRIAAREQIAENLRVERGIALSRAGLGTVLRGPSGVSDARLRQMGAEANEAAQRRAAIASEAAAKAAEKAANEAAKIAERIAKYNADVIDAVMRRPIGAGSRSLTASAAALNPGISFIGGPSLLRAGERAFGGPMGMDPASLERRAQVARDEADYQARKVQLLSGPGGELAAVQQVTAIRLRALEDEINYGATAFDIERQRLQIRRDGELQILEIQRARIAEQKADGAAIFDALTAGGAGVKRYATGFGMGIGRTIFSNAYSQFASGTMGKLSLTNDPNSMVGKILAGTPFGANPAAQAGQVQLTAGQLQLQAGTKMMAAASMMGGGGMGMLGGFGIGGGSTALPASVAMLNPFYKPSGNMARNIGLAGAGIGAGLGVMSGIGSGGAGGALTAIGSAAGGAAAILPALSSSLALAGPIGGAIAIGATLAMAFLPDPKEARRRSLEEQARQRAYEDATGMEFATDIRGRTVDYSKTGSLRVNLTVNAMDAQSIIDRQEDIGEAVRQALTSYPPLALDVRGAALGA